MSQKRELRQTNRKFGQLYSEEAVFLNKDRSGPRARGPGRPHASVERRPHPLGHQEGPGHREDRPLPRRLGGQQQLQSRQRHVALLVEKKDCRERERKSVDIEQNARVTRIRSHESPEGLPGGWTLSIGTQEAQYTQYFL